MPEEWQTLTSQIQGIMVAIGGLFALANCFFGYKLQKVWITLIGFFIGLAAGFFTSLACGLDAGPSLLIGAALGIVLGLIAFRLYRVGIFLLSFSAANSMFYALIPIPWAGIIVGIAGGILAGILAVKFLRPVIILITGIGYGLSAGQMLLSLFGVESLAVFLPVGGVLALAGVIVQFHTTNAGE